jgi:hypothetical protein
VVPLPEPVNLPNPSSLPTYVVDELHSFPCRRCLKDGAIGETMYLVSYDPFKPEAKSSPYQSASPIFVHTTECDRYSGSEIPDQQIRRLLSVRAFDKDHMMTEADVLKGVELEKKAKEMLGRGNAEYIHVHNATRGCFAVQIERA